MIRNYISRVNKNLIAILYIFILFSSICCKSKILNNNYATNNFYEDANSTKAISIEKINDSINKLSFAFYQKNTEIDSQTLFEHANNFCAYYNKKDFTIISTNYPSNDLKIKIENISNTDLKIKLYDSASPNIIEDKFYIKKDTVAQFKLNNFQQAFGENFNDVDTFEISNLLQNKDITLYYGPNKNEKKILLDDFLTNKKITYKEIFAIPKYKLLEKSSSYIENYIPIGFGKPYYNKNIDDLYYEFVMYVSLHDFQLLKTNIKISSQ